MRRPRLGVGSIWRRVGGLVGIRFGRRETGGGVTDAGGDEMWRAARVSRMAWVMVVGITVVMVGVLAQVGRLQGAVDDRLARAAGARVVARPVMSMRGDVLDRRGRLLATSRPAYRVIVDPLVFPGVGTSEWPAPTLDEAILRLAEAMGAPADQVGERVLWAKGVNSTRVAQEALETRSKEAMRRELIEVVSTRVFGVGRRGEDAVGAEDDGFAIDDGDEEVVKRPIRYLRVGGILDDDAVARVRGLRRSDGERRGIVGVHLERVPVRQTPGMEAAAIVGKVSAEHTGILGAERLLDAHLRGRDGRITYIRDAWGRPLWIEVDQITPEARGGDGRLSIDLEIQRIVREELWRGIVEADAAGGRAVVVDPHTGEVLAMVDLVREVAGLEVYPWIAKGLRGTSADRAPELFQARYRTIAPPAWGATGEWILEPALARNRCVEDVYEPGSTFKSFVWATIVDLGKAKPEEVFDTGGGTWRTSYGRIIKDVTKRRTMTWSQVLVYSSNIGMTQGVERLTHRQLHDAVRGLGFGSRTEIGLPGETAGIVTTMRAWSRYTQTSVSFGHEVAVTPVQMARAFCVFAREGDLAGTLPALTVVAREGMGVVGGRGALARPTIVHRTMSPATAVLTRRVLAEVMVGVDEKLARRDPPEKGWRYSMFGKSGTAMIPLGKPPEGMVRPSGTRGYYEGQYNSSFIAGAPLERPRVVMLVVIDDPGPAQVRSRRHYGSDVAAPVVRRSVERILPYLGVQPDGGAERMAGR